MASQRRPNNVVNLSDFAKKSKPTDLSSVNLKMLRADLSASQRVALKAAQLQSLRPVAAGVIERLVDRLLAEVG